jgi:hypothetical protein
LDQRQSDNLERFAAGAREPCPLYVNQARDRQSAREGALALIPSDKGRQVLIQEGKLIPSVGPLPEQHE